MQIFLNYITNCTKQSKQKIQLESRQKTTCQTEVINVTNNSLKNLTYNLQSNHSSPTQHVITYKQTQPSKCTRGHRTHGRPQNVKSAKPEFPTRSRPYHALDHESVEKTRKWIDRHRGSRHHRSLRRAKRQTARANGAQTSNQTMQRQI